MNCTRVPCGTFLTTGVLRRYDGDMADELTKEEIDQRARELARRVMSMPPKPRLKREGNWGAARVKAGPVGIPGAVALYRDAFFRPAKVAFTSP
jgi:hypothetical protein